MTTASVLELLEYLHQPDLKVRAIALHHVVGFTPKDSDLQPLLIDNRKTLCKDLKALCREDTITAHDAIKALTNLSADPRVLLELDDTEFVKHLVKLITVSKSVLADIACMLLSNMTKHEPICTSLIKAQTEPLPELCESERALDHLVEVFNKGYKKAYNEQANFDFLASIFSNISSIPSGRTFLLEPAPRDNLAPLTKIQVFSEDDNIIRRGGVCSTLQNCCFEARMHEKLLKSDELNTLPFILLPLCGSEEYDMEEFEKFPEEIQMLGEDKKRETDETVREMLLDALLLLTRTRFGREYLREKQVYRVIQRLHLQEPSEKIKEKCEPIVDMLVRDESQAEITQVEQDTMNVDVDEDEDEDEDFVIEEIA